MLLIVGGPEYNSSHDLVQMTIVNLQQSIPANYQCDYVRIIIILFTQRRKEKNKSKDPQTQKANLAGERSGPNNQFTGVPKLAVREFRVTGALSRSKLFDITVGHSKNSVLENTALSGRQLEYQHFGKDVL